MYEVICVAFYPKANVVTREVCSSIPEVLWLCATYYSSIVNSNPPLYLNTCMNKVLYAKAVTLVNQSLSITVSMIEKENDTFWKEL